MFHDPGAINGTPIECYDIDSGIKLDSFLNIRDILFDTLGAVLIVYEILRAVEVNELVTSEMYCAILLSRLAEREHRLMDSKLIIYELRINIGELRPSP